MADFISNKDSPVFKFAQGIREKAMKMQAELSLKSKLLPMTMMKKTTSIMNASNKTIAQEEKLSVFNKGVQEEQTAIQRIAD